MCNGHLSGGQVLDNVLVTLWSLLCLVTSAVVLRCALAHSLARALACLSRTRLSDSLSRSPLSLAALTRLSRSLSRLPLSHASLARLSRSPLISLAALVCPPRRPVSGGRGAGLVGASVVCEGVMVSLGLYLFQLMLHRCWLPAAVVGHPLKLDNKTRHRLKGAQTCCCRSLLPLAAAARCCRSLLPCSCSASACARARTSICWRA
jgi:hypothetical protein